MSDQTITINSSTESIRLDPFQEIVSFDFPGGWEFVATFSETNVAAVRAVVNQTLFLKFTIAPPTSETRIRSYNLTTGQFASAFGQPNNIVSSTNIASYDYGRDELLVLTVGTGPPNPSRYIELYDGSWSTLFQEPFDTDKDTIEGFAYNPGNGNTYILTRDTDTSPNDTRYMLRWNGSTLSQSANLGQVTDTIDLIDGGHCWDTVNNRALLKRRPTSFGLNPELRYWTVGSSSFGYIADYPVGQSVSSSAPFMSASGLPTIVAGTTMRQWNGEEWVTRGDALIGTTWRITYDQPGARAFAHFFLSGLIYQIQV